MEKAQTQKKMAGVPNLGRQKLLFFLEKNRQLRFNRSRTVLISQFIVKGLRPVFLKRFYLTLLNNWQWARCSMGSIWFDRIRRLAARFRYYLQSLYEVVGEQTDISRRYLKKEFFELTSG